MNAVRPYIRLALSCAALVLAVGAWLTPRPTPPTEVTAKELLPTDLEAEVHRFFAQELRPEIEDTVEGLLRGCLKPAKEDAVAQWRKRANDYARYYSDSRQLASGVEEALQGTAEEAPAIHVE